MSCIRVRNGFVTLADTEVECPHGCGAVYDTDKWYDEDYGKPGEPLPRRTARRGYPVRKCKKCGGKFGYTNTYTSMAAWIEPVRRERATQ